MSTQFLWISEGALNYLSGETAVSRTKYLISLTFLLEMDSFNGVDQQAGILSDECDIVTPDAHKMRKLAEQCLERVKSTTKLSKVEVQPAVLEPPKPSYKPGHRRVLSDGGETASPFLPPEIFQRMQIVEAHCARNGADDLLPILSYVALKSDLPQLVSECAALEEFIHEGNERTEGVIRTLPKKSPNQILKYVI
ncbi:UNVERIFIED_CONTAM: hypothetical protein FKN15_028909 [Acipenser sinensis]